VRLKSRRDICLLERKIWLCRILTQIGDAFWCALMVRWLNWKSESADPESGRFIFQGILRTCLSTVPSLAVLYPIHIHPLQWSLLIFLLVFLALWASFFPFWNVKTLFSFSLCFFVSENAVTKICRRIWSIFLFLENF